MKPLRLHRSSELCSYIVMNASVSDKYSAFIFTVQTILFMVNLRHVKEPKSNAEVATFGKILGNFSPIVSLPSFQTWGTPGGGSWNVLITGPPSGGFDVPLTTTLCKHLPAENTQR